MKSEGPENTEKKIIQRGFSFSHSVYPHSVYPHSVSEPWIDFFRSSTQASGWVICRLLVILKSAASHRHRIIVFFLDGSQRMPQDFTGGSDKNGWMGFFWASLDLNLNLLTVDGTLLLICALWYKTSMCSRPISIQNKLNYL